MEMGLGRLGLAPFHFYSLTLGELRMASRGYLDSYETRERAEWERTRWLAVRMLAPHVKKGSKLQAQDLGVFPWEKPDPGIKLSKDELRVRIENRDIWHV